MIRAAVILFAAAVAAAGCHTTLNFGAAPAPDGSTGCATDQDCPLASLHCEPFSGQCLACVSDSNCTSTTGRPHCDSILHFCVQCAGDQDCTGAGMKCNPATRTCIKPCSTLADCPTAGTWCNDGVCSQCDDDFHCPSVRTYCDSSIGQCTACVTDAQCTAAAAPHCNRAVGACVGCVTSTDCPGGTVCDPADSTCK